MRKNEYQDMRQHILDIGYGLVAGKGFSAVGLAEILDKSGIPKGSFYHYFASKEQFAQTLIDEYFADYLTRLKVLLQQPGLTAPARLMAYFELWQQNQGATGFDAKRCLVVKLSAEVADLSESMRLSLLAGCRQVVALIAICIAEGQREGTLALTHNAEVLAEVLYYLWLGASLANKLLQDDTPFAAAMQYTRAVLAVPNP